jgi:DNA polymerase III subunit epsilon
VTFCVLDIETTGSDRNHDAITEVGAVKVRGGGSLGTFQTLVDPGCVIPPTITMLTGITQSMVVRAPRFHHIAPTLQEFVGDSVIVGHNVGFDMAFLNAGLQRSGRAPFGNLVLDTLPLARRLVRDEVPDCRLGTLASRLRLGHRPTHRALDDALATADLLHLLLERAAGLGVLGLDDLIDLPTMAGHPQVGKLRLTDHLPRRPGVYRFHAADGSVLYVGKATNLRQRVRSYFGGDDRRKVGGLLRETRRISHDALPVLLAAEVLELRTIHRSQPRYNSAGTRTASYRWVQLDPAEPWARLRVVARPSPGSVAFGPVGSSAHARLVVEALEQSCGLRRCSTRVPSHRAKGAEPSPRRTLDGVAVCPAAQLGRPCPCAGRITAGDYLAAVQRATAAMTHSPHIVVEALRARMVDLAATARYEEAAGVRDRLSTFVAVARRQRLARNLAAAGRLTVQLNEAVITIDSGVLQTVQVDGALPMPLPLPGPRPPEAHLPMDAEVFDEVVCIARHLERHARSVTVLDAAGSWAMPVKPLFDLTHLDAAS